MANAILTMFRGLNLKAFVASLGLLGLWASEGLCSEVSGVYIDASPHLVEMVQIVKTPDGRIAGRIESTTLDDKGKLKTYDFAIEGAADGNQVTLSARSILFNGDISLSGFVDGDLLDLSGAGEHRTYQRADTYAYQIAVTGLQAQAGHIQAALSADKATKNHSEVTEILNKLRAKAPDINRQLDKAAEYYEKLYKRLHNRRRAANTYWNMDSFDGLARQADQEALQVENEIRRVDDDVRRLFDNLKQDIKRADKLTASVQTYCVDHSADSGRGLCSDTAVKEQELTSLSDGLHAAFDTLAARKEQASIDIPPGQKLLKKIFD
ncbi:hypothetical protein [Hyphococcus sp.]|uniref:hypothetical protein n=1 Tax=Hyphococcus sp. TaxID=2038636 RepID=UPI003CCB8AAE